MERNSTRRALALPEHPTLSIRPARAGLLVLLVLAAVAAPPGRAADVDRLLDVSGFDRQLAELPAQIKAGLTAGMVGALGDPAAAKEIDALEASVDEAFDPAPQREALADALETALDETQLAALLDWYTSGLGRRLTGAEVRAASPDVRDDLVAEVPALLQDPERVARAQRIAAVHDVTDFAVAQQRRTILATAMLVGEFAPPGEAPDLDALADRLDAVEPALRLQLMQTLQLSYLYTYREFELEEIDAYIAFMETDACRTFVRLAYGAVGRTGQVVVDGMLVRLGERLEQRSPQRRERDAA